MTSRGLGKSSAHNSCLTTAFYNYIQLRLCLKLHIYYVIFVYCIIDSAICILCLQNHISIYTFSIYSVTQVRWDWLVWKPGWSVTFILYCINNFIIIVYEWSQIYTWDTVFHAAFIYSVKHIKNETYENIYLCTSILAIYFGFFFCCCIFWNIFKNISLHWSNMTNESEATSTMILNITFLTNLTGMAKYLFPYIYFQDASWTLLTKLNTQCSKVMWQ